VDQNIPDQQNLSDRKIALLILSAPTNRLRDLRLLIPTVLQALNAIRPGQVERVSYRPS